MSHCCASARSWVAGPLNGPACLRQDQPEMGINDELSTGAGGGPGTHLRGLGSVVRARQT